MTAAIFKDVLESQTLRIKVPDSCSLCFQGPKFNCVIQKEGESFIG